MHRHLPFYYRFYPAGQGIFSSGILWDAPANRESFRWIYDCGSTAPVTVLQPKVVEYRREMPSNYLHLLCISHFDKDHVSGLHSLLSGLNVGTIVIPYFSPLTRLVLGALWDDAPAFYAEFISNPIAWLLETTASIERIIVVGKPENDDVESFQDRPSGNGPPPPNRFLDRKEANWPLKYANFELTDVDLPSTLVSPETKALAVHLGTQLVQEPSSFAATVPCPDFGGWEFLFYHKKQAPGVAHQLQAGLKRLFAQMGPPSQTDLLTALSSKTTVKLIRDVYASILGRNDELNAASLCLYAGPVKRTNLEDSSYVETPRPIPPTTSGFGMHDEIPHGLRPPNNSAACSLLCTGDADFTDAADRDLLRAFLTMKRWNAIAVLQVPHHGSKYNWSPGASSEFSHRWSVFCADPNYKYHHPDQEVLLDLLHHGPVLADKQREWTWWGEAFFTSPIPENP